MMQLLAIGECMVEMSGGQDNAWRMGFAGDTLNTAWYARAGLDPAGGGVGYFTALGRDTISARILAFLEGASIDTRHIRRIEGRRPGLYLIEQIAGDRHFTYWREHSAARLLAEDEPALAAAIGAARAIYFSGITLAILPPEGRARLIACAGAAREAGTLVAFDPNIRLPLWESARAMRASVTEAAAASSLVLPSFDDEERAFADASPRATAERYRASGAAEVAVKNGAESVLVADGDGVSEHSVPPAPRVVDTTAAGDSFNGAYLAARIGGRTSAEAAAAGIALASHVIGVHGAIVATPSMSRWTRRR